MTDLTLYGLKNCDTCKKARKALEGAGHTVTFVDIRAEADGVDGSCSRRRNAP